MDENEVFYSIEGLLDLIEEKKNQISEIEISVSQNVFSFIGHHSKLKRLRAELEYLLDKYSYFTTYSSTLLFPYLLKVINIQENYEFVFKERVYVSEEESMNQKISAYIHQLYSFIEQLCSEKKSLAANFQTRYCGENFYEYDVILPEEESVCKNYSYLNRQDQFGQPLSMFPVLCYHSGKKIKLLDERGNLPKKMQEFPYLKQTVYELINYHISNPSFDKEEVIQHFMDTKKIKRIQF